ncbi:hypothetical protein AXI76_gp052 [Pseudoalteromonas phage H101]|uniref:Uncharacterized protein n=1 Tax=Pseudoalteromonas phage H101 TaxID=1654919 RepID=A0A0H4IRQ1_9CAUD|nr:hypothetical protein AXI76_gp052 [Pseudoalteromonas phage H101]AKO60953.1 hypothetical protein [Pseudoalteromonas phage H101]
MTKLENIINEAFNSLDLDESMLALKWVTPESKLLCIIEHMNTYNQACDEWIRFSRYIQDLGYLSDDGYHDAVVKFQSKEVHNAND